MSPGGPATAPRSGRSRGHGRNRDDETERPVRSRFVRLLRLPCLLGVVALHDSGRLGAAATTLAATTGTAVAGRGSSSSAPAVADSYSATEAKTASPAEAARARVAGSPVTIDSRLSWVSASRDRSRKLIRDVATREPYGSTTAIRAASEARMRAAADVISSSTSR